MLPTLVLILAADPAAVSVTKTADALEFRAGAEVAARYQYAGTVEPEKAGGSKPLAKPFFWPLVAPGGVKVTRGWPVVRGTAGETKDHFHQKSAWFCHGDVIPDGIELKTRSADKRVRGVNFWDENPGHGRIVCVSVSDAVGGRVETKNEWRTPDGVNILSETRVIDFRPADGGYLFVLEIDLFASACGVTFGDTKEGAMGVRVADDLRTERKGGDGRLANSAGKLGEKDVWGHPADWCDYSGTVGGKVAGIAVFDDARNPHRSAWHARGYGLMAANPFGRGESGFPSRKGTTDVVKLAKGDHLKLRYAIFTHAGDAAAGNVAVAYAGFAK